MASDATASARALSHRSRFRASQAARATRYQADGPSNQKRAISVCSGVRTELTWPPTDFTSLKSRAYSALDSAGGPGSQYCDADSSVNGVTLPQPGMADDAKPGASLGSAMGG